MMMRALSPSLIVIVAFAVLFYCYVAVSAWNNAAWAIGWLLSALIPFVAALIIAVISHRSMVGIVPTAIALVFSVWAVYDIRTSTSSTAAIAYLWLPLWNLVIVVVSGAATYLVLRHHGQGSNRAT